MDLEIKFWPHPSLLSPCQNVTKVDKQLLDWIKEMQSIVVQHDAAGLAANQVGLPYRVYVTADRVYINPVIQRYFGGFTIAEEGCLSMPDTYLKIARSKKIAMNAFDECGNEIKTTLSGLESRVAQHEVDHISGLMHFNRLPPSELMNSGLLAKLDSIQTVFLQSAESGEIDLAGIQQELIKLKLERTSWKLEDRKINVAEKESTTVGV